MLRKTKRCRKRLQSLSNIKNIVSKIHFIIPIFFYTTKVLTVRIPVSGSNLIDETVN